MDLVLLEFRNTPITGLDESPAQLLMSRRLRTHMPTIPTLLKPTISEGIRERLTHRQQKQKGLYDRGAKPQPDLAPGDSVRYRVNKAWKPATARESTFILYSDSSRNCYQKEQMPSETNQ